MRVPFFLDAPLENGEVPEGQKSRLDRAASLAMLAGSDKAWSLSPSLDPPTNAIHEWFREANNINPARWVQAIEATARYYNHPIAFIEPFNEPDWTNWRQGSKENLRDILAALQASRTLGVIPRAGPSTLASSSAEEWYLPIKTLVAKGTTHALWGNFDSYVNFLLTVSAAGARSFNPEAHNLVEVISGAHYGLSGAIWWAEAERARGEFATACLGRRLAYAEDRPAWSAAAVYRAPTGAVQAFIGSSERLAQPVSYLLVSKDRDVFFNGDGPRREFLVPVKQNDEDCIEITWGEDAAEVLNGRYILVNRRSHLVLEVPGGSDASGAGLQENSYAGQLYQQWDITRLTGAQRDQSFSNLKAAHSGKCANVARGSFDAGGAVIQWPVQSAKNEQWHFEYAGGGCYCIRSRLSGLYMEAASDSIGSGIRQANRSSDPRQQWRIIPAGAPVEFTAPPAPRRVRAAAHSLSVEVSWDRVAAPDLAGYTVLRSLSRRGPYDIIARGVTGNRFIDNSASQRQPYYYVVRAVDRSWNSSSSSEEAPATPACSPALAAHYTFDDSIADTSGNANNPAATRSTFFVPGKYGSAISFDAHSQLLTLPPGMLASVTNFTIAVCVNWDGGAAWQRIFDFGNDTVQYMYLTPASIRGKLQFGITTNSSAGEEVLEGPAIHPGQWTHVAVTRAGNTLSLYVNGTAVNSKAGLLSLAAFNPSLNFLGKSQFDDPLFKGRLDELYIFNYALSAAEILNLTANRAPPSDLHHHLPPE